MACHKQVCKPADRQAGQLADGCSCVRSTCVIEAAGLGDEPLPPALIEDASALPIPVQECRSSCVDADSGCRAAARARALTRIHALSPAAPVEVPLTDGLPSSSSTAGL